MKGFLVLLFAVSLSASVSLTASTASAKDDVKRKTARFPASEWLTEMNGDAGYILTILHKSCPEKFAEVMKGANRVSKILQGRKELPGKRELAVWQIFTSNFAPAPSFFESPVAMLSIEWTSIPEEGPIAADKGTDWEIVCKVERK